MLIIFEGPDKTGKSTLIRELNKRTKFKHIVLDRGPISSLVYNSKFAYNRGYDEEEYLNIFKALKDNNIPYIIIYCMASNEAIRQRLRDAGEVLDANIYNIDNIRIAFKIYINKCKMLFGTNVLNVDTEKSIEEVLQEIEKAIEENE